MFREERKEDKFKWRMDEKNVELMFQTFSGLLER